jgi:hypothetical protein
MTAPKRQQMSVPRQNLRSDPTKPAPAPRQMSADAWLRLDSVGWESARRRYESISAGEYGAFARSRDKATRRGSPTSTRSETNRRLLLIVRTEPDDIALHPEMQNRSITLGWHMTSGVRSRPQAIPKAPSLEVANRSARALCGLEGEDCAVTCLANTVASVGTVHGLNSAIARRTSGVIQYIYSRKWPTRWILAAKLSR